MKTGSTLLALAMFGMLSGGAFAAQPQPATGDAAPVYREQSPQTPFLGAVTNRPVYAPQNTTTGDDWIQHDNAIPNGEG